MPGRAAHSIWFEVLGEHGIPSVRRLGRASSSQGQPILLRIAQIARGRPELRWAGDLARMSQVAFVAYITAGSLLSLSYWDLFWTLIVVLGATHRLVLRGCRDPTAAMGRNSLARRASVAVPGGRRRCNLTGRRGRREMETIYYGGSPGVHRLAGDLEHPAARKRRDRRRFWWPFDYTLNAADTSRSPTSRRTPNGRGGAIQPGNPACGARKEGGRPARSEGAGVAGSRTG